MNKKTKIIVGIVVAVIVVAVLGVVISQNVGKKGKSENIQTSSQNTESRQVESQQAESKQEDTTLSEGVTTGGEEKQTQKGKKKKKADQNATTNYWDNVQVYEDAGSDEEITNEKGEKITEAYPGENDGWSPIVSPDDLEK